MSQPTTTALLTAADITATWLAEQRVAAADRRHPRDAACEAFLAQERRVLADRRSA